MDLLYCQPTQRENNEDVVANIISRDGQHKIVHQERQQSFEMVKNTTHSSLALLAYLRHLFPSTCFTKTGFEVKFVQDSNVAVKTFLGWVNGALDGVHRGAVNALQFCVCPTPDDTTKVLESYVLRFQYEGTGQSGRRTVSGMEMSGACTSPTYTSTSPNDQEKLLRQIVTCADKLPDLPETRFLACQIYFESDPSSDFPLYGFAKGPNTKMSFPSVDWYPMTGDVGTVITSHHRVSLEITAPEVYGHVDSHDAHDLPAKMSHGRVLSRGLQCARNVSRDSTQSTDDLNHMYSSRSDHNTHVTDSLIVTQQLPVELQLDEDVRRIKLLLPQEWQAHRRSPFVGYKTRAGNVNCQCGHSDEEGEM
ncbi:MAG: hypothetical protein Q9183_002920, partial [Haloplaca sp. 2 TL-2023]